MNGKATDSTPIIKRMEATTAGLKVIIDRSDRIGEMLDSLKKAQDSLMPLVDKWVVAFGAAMFYINTEGLGLVKDIGYSNRAMIAFASGAAVVLYGTRRVLQLLGFGEAFKRVNRIRSEGFKAAKDFRSSYTGIDFETMGMSQQDFEQKKLEDFIAGMDVLHSDLDEDSLAKKSYDRRVFSLMRNVALALLASASLYFCILLLVAAFTGPGKGSGDGTQSAAPAAQPSTRTPAQGAGP